MQSSESSLEEIDAILITHEHGDHIHALKVLLGKYPIPVLCNAATAKKISTAIYPRRAHFKIFASGESFTFRDLFIFPFSVQHDGVDPVAFTIEVGDKKAGFCTDLGFVSHTVRQALQNCHYLYLEANHHVSMVHACPRPLVYKQRVLSRSGHLSNEEAARLISELHHEGLEHVSLAHLSSECNSPEIALSYIRNFLKKENKAVELSVAPQKIPGKKITLSYSEESIDCPSEVFSPAYF